MPPRFHRQSHIRSLYGRLLTAIYTVIYRMYLTVKYGILPQHFSVQPVRKRFGLTKSRAEHIRLGIGYMKAVRIRNHPYPFIKNGRPEISTGLLSVKEIHTIYTLITPHAIMTYGPYTKLRFFLKHGMLHCGFPLTRRISFP